MYQRIEESNCIWQRNVTDRLFSLCIESKKGPFFKRWLFPSRVLLWGLRNIFEAAALTSIFTYFLPSFFKAFCLNWGSKSVSQRLKENFLELLFKQLTLGITALLAACSCAKTNTTRFRFLLVWSKISTFRMSQDFKPRWLYVKFLQLWILWHTFKHLHWRQTTFACKDLEKEPNGNSFWSVQQNGTLEVQITRDLIVMQGQFWDHRKGTFQKNRCGPVTVLLQQQYTYEWF